MSAAPKLDNNPLFDKKLINAFIQGVQTTLESIASTKTTITKPFVESEFSLKGDIAGMVGMVAPPMKGTLLISFPKAAIFQILENMLGEKHTEVSAEVADAVGELTNMIYGSAKTTLNEQGYSFEMAIPTVIRGDFTITKGEKGATLVIPFQLENQTSFYVEITVLAVK